MRPGVCIRHAGECFSYTARRSSHRRRDLAGAHVYADPIDLNDLDHHMVYTWRIDNISLANLAIASASLTFTNISNWDSNANVLHIHLLDTAKGAGVSRSSMIRRTAHRLRT